MSRLSHLRRALDKLFEARRDLYNRTNHLSEEDLLFKPAPDSWSVGEVMDHIIKSETQFVAQLRRRLERPSGDPADDTLLSHLMRPFIYAGLIYGSSLIKFEAAKEIRPVHGYPHMYLIHKLALVREVTFDIAERLARRDQTVYLKDVRTGTVFSGEDWLYLIGLHEERHVGQVERVLAALEASKKKGPKEKELEEAPEMMEEVA